MDKRKKLIVGIGLISIVVIAAIVVAVGFETVVPIRLHIRTTESNFTVYLTQADETGTSGEFEEIQLSQFNSSVFMGNSQKSYTSNFWVFVKVDVAGETLVNVFAIPRHPLIQRPNICTVYLTISTINGELYLDVDDVILHSIVTI